MIEAIVIGRVGVDLTPATPRTTLAAADAFVRAVGGFAGNIGTGLARLGIRTAVVSAVGDDGHGDHVRSFLAGEGIDVGPIVTRPGSRTQVAFFEVWPPERFPVTFYRPPPAPETRLTFADLPAELLATAPLAIVSGTLLADEPARSTTLRILEDRRASRGRRTTSDDDPRPRLATDACGPTRARRPVSSAQAAELSDVLIGSDDGVRRDGPRPESSSPGRGPTLDRPQARPGRGLADRRDGAARAARASPSRSCAGSVPAMRSRPPSPPASLRGPRPVDGGRARATPPARSWRRGSCAAPRCRRRPRSTAARRPPSTAGGPP